MTSPSRRLRLTTRRAARPPLPLAGEGGVGVSHRSKLEESFPRPPRSASASTSPASGRGKRVALRADVPGIHVLTLAVMAGLDPAIHVFLGDKARTWITGTSPVTTDFYGAAYLQQS